MANQYDIPPIVICDALAFAAEARIAKQVLAEALEFPTGDHQEQVI